MIKFFDRLDAILDGGATPTPIEMVFLISTLLATLIGMVWLAAYIVELYK